MPACKICMFVRQDEAKIEAMIDDVYDTAAFLIKDVVTAEFDETSQRLVMRMEKRHTRKMTGLVPAACVLFVYET